MRGESIVMDLLFVLGFLFLRNVAVVLGQLDGSSLLALTPSTPSIMHFVNESFIIFCRSTIQKDINIKWKYPNGSECVNTKGRIHIEKKAGVGSLALVFEHIVVKDKGNWTCEASPSIAGAALIATGKDARKSFELLVNQKISFDTTELVQSAREGRDATVKCSVQGDPEPDISWLYNGEYISTANTTKHRKLSNGLFIRNVTQADAGEYTCRAMRITPTFSDADQVTILLRIQHKPNWFYNDSGPLYAYIGGDVNITCEAMGEPPPSFSWLRRGEALTGPNYRVFYADYGSTLQVHVHNDSQLGDYKCKVANLLGTLERIIQLRVGTKPVSPSRFQLKRLFTDGFEFDIRSTKYSNVPDIMQTIGYSVEYMSENDFKYCAGNWSHARRRDFNFHQGRRFLLIGLESNTTYLMRAATRNLAGLSDWSTVKIFGTLSNFASETVRSLAWHTCVAVALALLLISNFKSSPSFTLI